MKKLKAVVVGIYRLVLMSPEIIRVVFTKSEPRKGPLRWTRM